MERKPPNIKLRDGTERTVYMKNDGTNHILPIVQKVHIAKDTENNNSFVFKILTPNGSTMPVYPDPEKILPEMQNTIRQLHDYTHKTEWTLFIRITSVQKINGKFRYWGEFMVDDPKKIIDERVKEAGIVN